MRDGCEGSRRSRRDGCYMAQRWHSNAQYSHPNRHFCYHLLQIAARCPGSLPRVGESPLFSTRRQGEWERASADRCSTNSAIRCNVRGWPSTLALGTGAASALRKRKSECPVLRQSLRELPNSTRCLLLALPSSSWRQPSQRCSLEIAATPATLLQMLSSLAHLPWGRPGARCEQDLLE